MMIEYTKVVRFIKSLYYISICKIMVALLIAQMVEIALAIFIGLVLKGLEGADHRKWVDRQIKTHEGRERTQKDY